MEQKQIDNHGLSEEQLLAQIALRNQIAFKQFYDLTSPRVYALVLRMMNKPAEADDVLQDVYLKVWHTADSYNPARGQAMTWLYAIARNRVIDVIRSAVSRYEGDQNTSVDEQASSLVQEISDSNMQGYRDDPKLGHCIDELEPEQRQSIFVAFFHGLTHVEIASRFAEPIGTVKSRIRRGLAALRLCLES